MNRVGVVSLGQLLYKRLSRTSPEASSLLCVCRTRCLENPTCLLT